MTKRLLSKPGRVIFRLRRPYPGWYVRAFEVFLWRLGLSAGFVTDMALVPRKWWDVRRHSSYSYGDAWKCITLSAWRVRLGAAWRTT